jgi:hypothetical protein
LYSSTNLSKIGLRSSESPSLICVLWSCVICGFVRCHTVVKVKLGAVVNTCCQEAHTIRARLNSQSWNLHISGRQNVHTDDAQRLKVYYGLVSGHEGLSR